MDPFDAGGKSKQLHAFFCRDCEIEFDSPFDEMGREQAFCPKCREICMTVAFEREEQERHNKEARFFSFLGRITHLFRLRVKEPPPRERDRSEALTIVTYENRSDADQDMAALAREGIIATLKENSPTLTSNQTGNDHSPTYELQVPANKALYATKILREMNREEAPPAASTGPASGAPAPAALVDDITFDCDECGKSLTFPGNRRGGIETCPHCLQYVDVPE